MLKGCDRVSAIMGKYLCVCNCTTYFHCGKIYLQYATVHITCVFKNIILIHNSGMPQSWLSWRPASRLLMTSRQVSSLSTFHGFNPIRPRGGHNVPPLSRICVYLGKYAYKCVEKNLTFLSLKFGKGHYTFYPLTNWVKHLFD